MSAGSVLANRSDQRRMGRSWFSMRFVTQSSLQDALWQVGISMVFTDVHVNRAPIQGILTFACHKPGKFLSLRREEALNLNERQTLIIENPGQDMQVMLVQIASRLVRQIVAYLKEGQSVNRGQRVGYDSIWITSGSVPTHPQSDRA